MKGAISMKKTLIKDALKFMQRPSDRSVGYACGGGATI